MKQEHDTVLESEDRLPLVEYVCFRNSGVGDPSVVGILRGFGSANGWGGLDKGSPAEAISLHLHQGLRCIDLAMYKVRLSRSSVARLLQLFTLDYLLFVGTILIRLN